MLKISKYAIVAAVAALTLIGCAKQQPAPIPVGPQAAPKATPKADKPAAPYTVTASNGWQLVSTTSLKPGENAQILAIYENELGRTDTEEKISARAGLVAGNLTEADAETWYDDIRSTAHNRPNSRVLKERMVKLGDLPAYEWLDIRAEGDNAIVDVGVTVTNGKVGYVFNCGSSAEYAEQSVPACVELIESLRITK